MTGASGAKMSPSSGNTSGNDIGADDQHDVAAATIGRLWAPNMWPGCPW